MEKTINQLIFLSAMSSVVFVARCCGCECLIGAVKIIMITVLCDSGVKNWKIKACGILLMLGNGGDARIKAVRLLDNFHV